MRSNTAMDTSADRLTELEIKVSFMDDLLDELNQTLVRQQHSMDLLRREVAELKARLADAGSLSTADASARALADRPPHY